MRATDKQFELLLWVDAGAFLFGIILWSVLPGAVARSLPEGWHVPEWIATRATGVEQKEAGKRMIRAAIYDEALQTGTRLPS